jgi:hypothetical protein
VRLSVRFAPFRLEQDEGGGETRWVLWREMALRGEGGQQEKTAERVAGQRRVWAQPQRPADLNSKQSRKPHLFPKQQTACDTTKVSRANSFLLSLVRRGETARMLAAVRIEVGQMRTTFGGRSDSD